jgi:hypothetical protein
VNLIDVYNMQQTRQLTEEEAARALGITVRSYRIRSSAWGHRLPLLLSVLDKIKADDITRDEAAATLNVSTREVNKLSATWNVTRPTKQYVIDRTASKVKWEVRKKFAIDFIAGAGSIDDAAEAAGVSARQMRRWVSELLQKHFEMPWKDLAKLTPNRRRRLAQEIEAAEGIELAKQQTLNAIARGDKTLHQEALERVAARKARRMLAQV